MFFFNVSFQIFFLCKRFSTIFKKKRLYMIFDDAWGPSSDGKFCCISHIYFLVASALLLFVFNVEKKDKNKCIESCKVLNLQLFFMLQYMFTSLRVFFNTLFLLGKISPYCSVLWRQSVTYKPYNAQKMKFLIKDLFSKCDQIRSFLWIWSHLLKKSLMANFIFCTVKYINKR